MALTMGKKLVYGIYKGVKEYGHIGPIGSRLAGLLTYENAPYEDIIKDLIAADFLRNGGEYEVIDNACSIHIHHKCSVIRKIGGIALVLMYENDFDQWCALDQHGEF